MSLTSFVNIFLVSLQDITNLRIFIILFIENAQRKQMNSGFQSSISDTIEVDYSNHTQTVHKERIS